MSIQIKLHTDGDIYEAINQKADAPSGTKAPGKVYGLDSQLHPVWTDQSGGGGADFPAGGYAGDLLAKRTNADGDVEWITPATEPEQNNTRPITAAAVYTAVGNINALLATI